VESITKYTHQKLALEVSLTGFSFAIINTVSNEILKIKEIDFSSYKNSTNTEECYKICFSEHPELTQKYDQIIVLHNNNLSGFVPLAMFDSQNLRNYLRYNIEVFETDFFAFDMLEKYQINNVYLPYMNINNVLLDFFPSFDYKHHSSILVEKLLDLSKNIDEKQMFVHLGQNKFEIIVLQNQKLLFYNSFDFSKEEDCLYYILFTAEQMSLNPEFFTLKLLGNIREENELFKLIYTYIRNVFLLDVSGLTQTNTLSDTQNLTHFVLVQS